MIVCWGQFEINKQKLVCNTFMIRKVALNAWSDTEEINLHG